MLGFPNAPFTFFPLDLEDYVSLSIVHWNKGDPDPKTGKSPGWHFATPEEEEGCIPDPIYGAKYLSEFYFKADTNYEGVYSVPVLWDKKVCLSRFSISSPLFIVWAARSLSKVLLTHKSTKL